MNAPIDQLKRAKLRSAHKLLNGNAAFVCHMEWLKEQLALRDVENRKRGFENLTTEAEALDFIVKQVDADQAPEIDPNSAEARAERESAQPVM